MDYLPAVIHIAKQAGEILSSHFYSIFSHQITIKPDASPVTQADIAASRFIEAALQKLTPHFPVLSEENDLQDFSVRQTWEKYWLVDPLDGTKGFINRTNEFCVSIALIEKNKPILGVLYAPIQQALYYAAEGMGAWQQHKETALPSPIKTTAFGGERLHLLCGHSHRNAHIQASLQQFFSTVALKPLNSALKFGLLASGDADLYVRFGPTSEWDTAAGHCIVNEAGGVVVDFQGNPLQYNAKASLINPAFLAIGDPSQLERYLNACEKVKTLVYQSS